MCTYVKMLVFWTVRKENECISLEMAYMNPIKDWGITLWKNTMINKQMMYIYANMINTAVYE